MSQKVKKKVSKRASSLSFSLSRWYRRISKIKLSTVVVAAIVIAFAVFIFGGGLFTIINRPIPAWYNGSKFYFLYPGLNGQFISDTVISATLYALGFADLLAVYQSTKSAYNPRQAYILLAVGISLLIVVYIALEGAINFKINPS